jgi:dynein heavy chain
MERFNTLLNKIRIILKNLKLAIDGMMVMSQELDSTYQSLINNQVPNEWVKVAYPSLKPLASWIADLKERVQTM